MLIRASPALTKKRPSSSIDGIVDSGTFWRNRLGRRITFRDPRLLEVAIGLCMGVDELGRRRLAGAEDRAAHEQADAGLARDVDGVAVPAHGVAMGAREQEHPLDAVHRAAKRVGPGEVADDRVDAGRKRARRLAAAQEGTHAIPFTDQVREQRSADLAAAADDEDAHVPSASSSNRVAATPEYCCWPVMRWPSRTACGLKRPLTMKLVLGSRLASSSIQKGWSFRPTKSSANRSSAFAKPVHVLPSTSSSPSVRRVFSSAQVAWQTTTVGLPAAWKAARSRWMRSSSTKVTIGPWPPTRKTAS